MKFEKAMRKKAKLRLALTGPPHPIGDGLDVGVRRLAPGGVVAASSSLHAPGHVDAHLNQHLREEGCAKLARARGNAVTKTVLQVVGILRDERSVAHLHSGDLLGRIAE